MHLQRWQKLMLSFGLDENRETYDNLIKAYAEKHRFYHTFEHVSACLKHLDKVEHLATHSHEIEMALWFHDAVYKPLRKDNELKSANWAKDFLFNNKVNAETCKRIFQLIMVTINHTNCESCDEKLMVDIDLSILGSSIEVYNQFEKNVRKEYRFVPYFLYRKKRKEVLQHFLTMKPLYHSKFFSHLFEKQARYNLKQAITPTLN